jgi:hypothetical protein
MLVRRGEQRRKPLAQRGAGGGAARVNGDDAAARIGEREQVGAADLPEFEGAVLDGAVVAAGQERLEGGQFGKQGVLAVQGAEPLGL